MLGLRVSGVLGYRQVRDERRERRSALECRREEREIIVLPIEQMIGLEICAGQIFEGLSRGAMRGETPG